MSKKKTLRPRTVGGVRLYPTKINRKLVLVSIPEDYPEDEENARLQRSQAWFGRQMLALFDVLDMTDRGLARKVICNLVPGSKALREETLRELAAAAKAAGSGALARTIAGIAP